MFWINFRQASIIPFCLLRCRPERNAILAIPWPFLNIVSIVGIAKLLREEKYVTLAFAIYLRTGPLIDSHRKYYWGRGISTPVANLIHCPGSTLATIPHSNGCLD